MPGIVTWLTTYATYVDGHHRAQLLAAADEIAELRAQLRAFEPVGWASALWAANPFQLGA